MTIGGSYAGAMSAWFRSKYQHLTVGAIGSSGVVLAVEDFSAFDEQIYQSALKNGEKCPAVIKEINNKVEEIINGEGREAFQAEFGADKLTAREFLFYWADVIVFPFQYSKGASFCHSLTEGTTAQAFEVIKKLVSATSPDDYGAYYLANATYARYIIFKIDKPAGVGEPGSTKVALNSVISKHPANTPCDPLS